MHYHYNDTNGARLYYFLVISHEFWNGYPTPRPTPRPTHKTSRRATDAQTQTRLQVFEGHEGPILSAAFSTDGDTIVTGSSDRTARVWDPNSSHYLVTLGPNAGAVCSVAFAHRSGDVLVAAGALAKIWHGDGSPGLEFPHDSPALAAAFTDDDTTIAVGCRDGSVWLWNAVTGAEIARLRGHSAGVVDVEFMSGGSTLCSACGDGNVRERFVRTRDLIEFVDKRIARAAAPYPLDRTYDDPEYLRERAWEVVRNGAGTPDAYRSALRWAEAADDLRHESPEFRVVLGVAQHRAGGKADALRTLEEVDSKLGEKRTGTHLVCVAALALVHHASGADDKARDDLARLDRLSATASDPVPHQSDFLDEARALRREIGSGK